MTSNETTEFYVTIPSWASQSSYFSNNTIGNFRVQLPLPVDLKGVWSVGLSQIQYTKSWYNIEANRNIIFVTQSDTNYKIFITEGYYTSEEQLIKEINKNIQQQSNIPERVFKYDLHSGKCIVDIPDRTIFYIGKHLGSVLGFDNYTLTGKQESITPVNLNHNCEALYVYCDLIEDQIVGEEKWKLINFFNVEKNTFGTSVNHTCTNPQYVCLAKKNFETIHIKLCNQYKEVIYFQKGVSIVQLHFKLSKIPLFY